MNRAIIIDVICALLLFFFLFTALSSFFGLGSLKNMLAFYTANTALSAWLLILTELLIATLLYFKRTKTLGLIAVIAIALFAEAVIRNYARYPHDFGGIFNDINGKRKLLLLITLILLSTIGLVLKIFSKKSNVAAQAPQKTVVAH